MAKCSIDHTIEGQTIEMLSCNWHFFLAANRQMKHRLWFTAYELHRMRYSSSHIDYDRTRYSLQATGRWHDADYRVLRASEHLRVSTDRPCTHLLPAHKAHHLFLFPFKLFNCSISDYDFSHYEIRSDPAGSFFHTHKKHSIHWIRFEKKHNLLNGRKSYTGRILRVCEDSFKLRVGHLRASGFKPMDNCPWKSWNVQNVRILHIEKYLKSKV